MAILLNKALQIQYSMVKPEIIIGRSSDSDLQLNFPTISKSHVRLVNEGDEWYAEDQESANCTYVNGEKIRRVALTNGDYLRMDIYTLVFFREEPPQLPELSVQDPGSVIRHRLPISKPLLRIGRNLKGNHIAIDDQRVSGLHMELERHDRRWLLKPAKPGVDLKVNQTLVEMATYVNPGDKIKIGSTNLEIIAPIVKEWGAASQVQTRLRGLTGTIRMQARTIEEAVHENFPAAKGEHEWVKLMMEIFDMVDRSLNELNEICETLRQFIPSMENIDSDNVILEQAMRDARRGNNLANYLDLVLRNNQLVKIQNAEMKEQRDLIRKLRDDIQNCLVHDHPTEIF